MSKKKCYRSCFIADVQISDEEIVLTDTGRGRFFIDPKNTEVIGQFKNWLKNDFIAGIAQHATVLKYEEKELNEAETELWVTKIFTHAQSENQMLNESKKESEKQEIVESK